MGGRWGGQAVRPASVFLPPHPVLHPRKKKKVCYVLPEFYNLELQLSNNSDSTITNLRDGRQTTKKIQQNIFRELYPKWEQGKTADDVVNLEAEDQQITRPTSQDSPVRTAHLLFPQSYFRVHCCQLLLFKKSNFYMDHL